MVVLVKIELLKKTKKLQKTGCVKLSSTTKTFGDNVSIKNSTSKVSVMSVTTKNTISNLKNDLKK
jgi:hypothetical protein